MDGLVFGSVVRAVLPHLVAAAAGVFLGASTARMAHRLAKRWVIAVAVLGLAFALGVLVEMTGLAGDTNLLSNAGAVAVGTFVGDRLRTRKGSEKH